MSDDINRKRVLKVIDHVKEEIRQDMVTTSEWYKELTAMVSYMPSGEITEPDDLEEPDADIIIEALKYCSDNDILKIANTANEMAIKRGVKTDV